MKKNKEQLLGDLFQSFQMGLRMPKAVAPKTYSKELGLDYNLLQVGYNSGKFHHRKPEAFKEEYESTGMLIKSDAPVNQKHLVAYSCHGSNSVVFPLKDATGKTRKNKKGNILNIMIRLFQMRTHKQMYEL